MNDQMPNCLTPPVGRPVLPRSLPVMFYLFCASMMSNASLNAEAGNSCFSFYLFLLSCHTLAKTHLSLTDEHPVSLILIILISIIININA